MDAITKRLGTPVIRRASHVEPTMELSQAACAIISQDVTRRQYVHQTRWWADMSPVAPGIVLGPFDTRDEALAEEVAWLTAQSVPLPIACGS